MSINKIINNSDTKINPDMAIKAAFPLAGKGTNVKPLYIIPPSNPVTNTVYTLAWMNGTFFWQD